MQSRSNSLVITDITYTDDQPVHVESHTTDSLQSNTNQISGHKRQREESSNEESKTKRRNTGNFVPAFSNAYVSQEKQDDSPAVTNAEPAIAQQTCANDEHSLNQETTSNDELLELLASWQ